MITRKEIMGWTFLAFVMIGTYLIMALTMGFVIASVACGVASLATGLEMWYDYRRWMK